VRILLLMGVVFGRETWYLRVQFVRERQVVRRWKLREIKRGRSYEREAGRGKINEKIKKE
jgi:hypothetical protein